MGFKWWQYPKYRRYEHLWKTKSIYQEGELTNDLQVNIRMLEDAFDYPTNVALKQRRFQIRALQTDAVILYIENAADSRQVERSIVKPLMEMENDPALQQAGMAPLMFIREHVLPALALKQVSTFQEIIMELLHGNTVLLLAQSPLALVAETPGFETRNVTTPQVEQAIRGPREAFVESADVNRSLVRKYIRDASLHCDPVYFGKHSSNKVYLMYMSNIASEELVNRVKKRIESIRTDTVSNLFMLEQLIEERPYSLLPSVLLTERPDRTASFLQEGHVAVIMENSPVALIAPVTFWALFHAAEDQYQRWASGNFMRIIRFLAILITMLIPAVYLAISTFHVEMLPTDLMLAISAARERVPFPVIVEIVFMELTFELIRESGIRVPAPIGTTIGIVGALVLGQAAVDANLVSPILVIIVAITGLASFIVPDATFNFSIRMQRFIFIIFGATMGFYGIGLYVTFVIAYLVSFTSFGVPFLSPMAPSMHSAKDMIIRPPLTKQWMRPANLNPQDPSKQDKPKG